MGDERVQYFRLGTPRQFRSIRAGGVQHRARKHTDLDRRRRPPPPLSLAGVDFGADLVGTTMALANYRTNIAVLKVANRIALDTLDLIA